jgi:uracil-DNA glycosylase family 4
MLKKPNPCRGCPLDFDWSGFSIPYGTGNNKIMVVGEALGEFEKIEATPFVRHAESGSVLETAFRKAGVKREDFILWNLIGCQPPNNKLENTNYEFQAINHCKTYFNQIVDKYKPKVFLALGSVPFKHLTGTNGPIGGITINRGYVFDSIYNGIRVVPSLHPSFINRKLRKHLGVLVRDIKRAIEVSKGIGLDKIKTNYEINPPISRCIEILDYLRNNPQIPISYDIETEYSRLEDEDIESNQDIRDIESIQFSYGEGHGLFLDWHTKEPDKEWLTDDEYDEALKVYWKNNPYTHFIIQMLNLPNPKIGWNNWLFDTINTEYHLGKGTIKGLNLDLMWAWHHYQPDVKWPGMKLQFVTNFYDNQFPAWKHLAQSDPYTYGCYDVDAVSRIYPKLISGLKNPNFYHKNLFSIDFTNQNTIKKTGIKSENVKTLYEGYIDDVVGIWPIFISMSERGLPIDLKAREEFRQEIKSLINETEKEIQDLYPYGLRKTSPIEGYKYVPKEVDRLTKEYKSKLALQRLGFTNTNGNSHNADCVSGTDNDSAFVLILDESKLNNLIQEYIEQNTRNDDKDTTGLIIREFKVNGGAEYRYCRVEKFKPASSQQVIKYLKFKNYKIPKKRNKDGTYRDTTDKENLFKLWQDTGDPLLERIILKRELDKMLSTYVGDSDINLYDEIEVNEDTNELVNKDYKQLGWPIGKDGRVHATFVPEPATGQSATRNPNIQNSPARGNQFSSKGYKELAQKFRKTIAAQNSKILVEVDYTGFHALMLGFEAECQSYMRLALLGAHDYIAAWIVKNELNNIKRSKILKDLTKKQIHETIEFLDDLNKWLSYEDKELKTKLKWIKKNFEHIRNSQAKPAVHGIGFGEGVRKLFNLNRHSFESVKEVQALYDLYFTLFPEIKDYQNKIRELAAAQGYLVSRYGYIRHFHDVYDWRIIKGGRNPKPNELITMDKEGRWWCRKPGMDSEACIAYLPANNAFGRKKEAFRDLWDYNGNNLINEFGLINDVHDSALFEMYESQLNEAIPIIQEIMERPTKVLVNRLTNSNGLKCLTEVKIGRNWAEMVDYV